MTVSGVELNVDRAAKRLFTALGRLRDCHIDMTVTQAMTLFFIADNPGCTQRDIFRTLEIEKPSTPVGP